MLEKDRWYKKLREISKTEVKIDTCGRYAEWYFNDLYLLINDLLNELEFKLNSKIKKLKGE